MKKIIKLFLSILCTAVISIPLFATAACTTPNNGGNNKDNLVDYASQFTLDFSTNTKKQEVSLRLNIDGDTTHFNLVRNSQFEGCDNYSDFSNNVLVPTKTKGYVKARYLAINTPESTGQIEPYGKAASDFTKKKMNSADKIIIESNDDAWHVDNTGDRIMLWVWYNTKEDPTFRNLNIEILQAGLAYGSNATEGLYGTYAGKALEQAREKKLYIYSGESDPDYYYGGPINIDLRELRFNVEAYVGKKVVVKGLIVADFNSSCYIEETYYDIDGYEDGIRIGFPILHFNAEGKVLDILSVGNYVKVVGVVVFYDNGGYYQITGIEAYDRWDKNNPNNCEIIEENVGVGDAFTEVDPVKFASTTKSVSVTVKQDGEDVVVDKTYAETLEGSSVYFSNLTVDRISTTTNEDSANFGAMTLYCKANGVDIQVRTTVLYDADGNKLTASDFSGQNISVKGIVEYYNGTYQIKCYRTDYINVI